MPSDELSDQPFYPHAGCDSGKFSPQKRAYYFALVSAETGLLLPQSSAETGLLLFSQNHRKPASSKGFQRPRARDKKLTTQEVKNIQVVGGSRSVENSAIFLEESRPHKSRGLRPLREKARGQDPNLGISWPAGRRLRGGVFMAEESLIEVVDAGVEPVLHCEDAIVQWVEPGRRETIVAGLLGELVNGPVECQASTEDHNKNDDGAGVHGGPDEQ